MADKGSNLRRGDTCRTAGRITRQLGKLVASVIYQSIMTFKRANFQDSGFYYSLLKILIDLLKYFTLNVSKWLLMLKATVTITRTLKISK